MPPKPDKNTFPKSWKKWRALKEGESIEKGDRYLVRGPNRTVSRYVVHSVGFSVQSEDSFFVPRSWYFWKIK